MTGGRGQTDRQTEREGGRELKKPLQDFSSRFVRDRSNPLTDPQTGLIIDHLAAISGRVRTRGRLSEEYAAEFTFQVKLLTPTTCRLSLCTAAHVRALHPPLSGFCVFLLTAEDALWGKKVTLRCGEDFFFFWLLRTAPTCCAPRAV